MEAYCVTCKEKVDVKNPKKETLSNGATAVRGKCSECEGKVYRILTGPTAKPAAKPAAKPTAKPTAKAKPLSKNGLFNALFGGSDFDTKKVPSKKDQEAYFTRAMSNIKLAQQATGGKFTRPSNSQVSTAISSLPVGLELSEAEKQAIIDNVWGKSVSSNPKKPAAKKPSAKNQVSKNSSTVVHYRQEEYAKDIMTAGKKEGSDKLTESWLTGFRYAQNLAQSNLEVSKREIKSAADAAVAEIKRKK